MGYCNKLFTQALMIVPTLAFFVGLPLILNSSVKCLVYAAADNDFRKHWRRFWSCCLRRRSAFVGGRLRRRNPLCCCSSSSSSPASCLSLKCCERSLGNRGFASPSSSTSCSSSSSSSPYLITLVHEQKTKGGKIIPSIVVEYVEGDV